MSANSSTSSGERNSRQSRHPERVGLAVEVQARQPGQPHARHVVELGVGRAGQHLDVVAERGELTAQVPDVDALAAAVRLAAVRQQRDRQGAGPVGGRGGVPVPAARGPGTR